MALESIRVIEKGDPAPEFDLDGTDGATYSPADFRDNTALLIVFTCNHCPYAQAKEAVLNAIAADYDEVAVIGINPNDETEYSEDSFAKMKEYVASGRFNFDAYLRDESQEVAAKYGSTCTPDPYLFRNDGGTFRLAYHGRLDDALNPDDEPTNGPGSEIKQAIDEVLAGERVTVDWNPSRGCSIKWREGNEPDYWDGL